MKCHAEMSSEQVGIRNQNEYQHLSITIKKSILNHFKQYMWVGGDIDACGGDREQIVNKCGEM